MDVNGQHWVQRLLHPKRGLRSFRASLDSDFQRTHPKDLITFCHQALERNPTYDPENFHRLSNQKRGPNQLNSGCPGSLAAEQRRIVEALALAVAPLEKHLDAVRCPSSKQVAAMKRPAFVAFITAFLRWPDLAQARHMVIGYNIVGEFESTGLFRQLPLDEVPTLQQWLGPSAIEAVDSLLRRGPPRFHEDILRITKEEQTAGFCGLSSAVQKMMPNLVRASGDH